LRAVTAPPARCPLYKPYRLGQRLKEIRQPRGLTRLALAQRIGASPMHISQIERGERALSDAGLRRIAEVLEGPCGRPTGHQPQPRSGAGEIRVSRDDCVLLPDVPNRNEGPHNALARNTSEHNEFPFGTINFFNRRGSGGSERWTCTSTRNHN
jgi:transcriptional regulator with XRE-family HTH domain